MLADLALGITAAGGIDQDCLLIAEVTGVEPRRKHRVPSCVVRAGGKLRDVVDRAIDLDAAKLANGVAAVRRAAATPIRNKHSRRSRTRSSSDARASMEVNEISRQICAAAAKKLSA
jgi:hypothetical protein